jgi:hypothetical protein
VVDFLEGQQRQIRTRMQELAPLVQEYRRLQEAATALAGINGGQAPTSEPPAPSPKRKRGPGRPRRAAKAATPKANAKPARKPRAGAGARQSGRRKGSGARAAEVVALVKGKPGITIPELAAKMGIKQNYLYRVLPKLTEENKVEKKGRGWHPTTS